MKLRDYIRTNKRIHIPYVANKFKVSPEQVSKVLLEFSNWTFVDNLLIFDYEGENPIWLEACDTKYVRGSVIPRDREDFFSQNNQKNDQHISVYAHDNKWREHFKETGNVRCRSGMISPNHIYLELDRDTLEEAMIDSIKIYNNFPYREFMKFWFSGNMSIHIEVNARLFGWNIITDISKSAGYGRLYYNLAHKIAGDARHDNGIADPHLLNDNELEGIYQFTLGRKMTDLAVARKELENIDPNIYNRNSLIRQRYSYHEKGGKQKIEFTIPYMAERVGVKEYEPKREIELKPYLVHWLFECYEQKRKETTTYKLDVDSGTVLRVFSKYIDNFDPNDADDNGWINQLYSPFYEDTNPSVSVNVVTGWYKDFGMPDHSFDIYTFYSMLNNINYEEAKKRIG